MKYFGLIFIFLFVHATLSGQNTITYPRENQVFQRSNNDEAVISIQGNYGINVTKIQAKLQPVQSNQGKETPWIDIDSNPNGGFFQGQITGKGGWYSLQIRLFDNEKLVDSIRLNRMGIGEVFVIAGQSNAQGIGKDKGDPGAKDERVISASFSNTMDNVADFNNEFKYIGSNTNFPEDQYRSLGTNTVIGPKGLSNYYWASLGDSLVTKFNVPVCFFNAGWGGTTSLNWAESAQNKYTQFIYVDYPFFQTGFPAENLKRILEVYGKKNGVRAVLWHQGETDVYANVSTETYKKNMEMLIESIRKSTGMNMPWLISKASYVGLEVNGGCRVLDNSKIANAQEQFVAEFANNGIFPGANTDQIEIPRKADPSSGCVHFTKESFPLVAREWSLKINDSFIKNSNPILPLILPTIDKYCSKNNLDSISVKIKSSKVGLYNQSDVLITGNSSIIGLPRGTYYYQYLDENNVSVKLPNFTFSGIKKPEKPTIFAESDTVFCAGDRVKLSFNRTGLQNNWSTGEKTQFIEIRESKSISLFVTNSQSCLSPPSALVYTRTLAKPNTQNISQSAPFQLFGGQQIKNNQFLWSLNDTKIAETSEYLKVKESGTYQLQIATVYSPTKTCLSDKTSVVYVKPESASGSILYPNPIAANDYLNLQFIGDLTNVQYQIFSIQGSLINSGTFLKDAIYRVKLENIAAGTYILSYEVNKQQINQTFTVY